MSEWCSEVMRDGITESFKFLVGCFQRDNLPLKARTGFQELSLLPGDYRSHTLEHVAEVLSLVTVRMPDTLW